jgi:hypothetical protein
MELKDSLKNSLLKIGEREKGFTLLELSFSLFIALIFIFSLISFQKTYASAQLKSSSRQLVSDIRYIQQQSMMNLGEDLQYKIKFRTKYLNNGNVYQIWRGDIQLKKEVKFPNSLELYFAGEPFSPDGEAGVRVLAYKATGEIATRMGTVNIRDKVNDRAVGIIVHRRRVRIGAPNEPQ